MRANQLNSHGLGAKGDQFTDRKDKPLIGRCNWSLEDIGWPAYRRARPRELTKRNQDDHTKNQQPGCTNIGQIITNKTTSDINNNHNNVHRSKDLKLNARKKNNKRPIMGPANWLVIKVFICFLASRSLYLIHQDLGHHQWRSSLQLLPFAAVEGSLIIGDSAIEIQELDGQTPTAEAAGQQQIQEQQQQQQEPQTKLSNTNQDHDVINANQQLIMGSTGGRDASGAQASDLTSSSGRSLMMSMGDKQQQQQSHANNVRLPSGPLPPIGGHTIEDITDGDNKSRNSHDYDMNELKDQQAANRQREMDQLSRVLSAAPNGASKFKYQDEQSGGGGGGDEDGKQITGKVVDFELTPAGGHNKAKIKKKKKMKKKKEGHQEAFKKWDKKKKMEKKAMEKKEKHHMKKKKEEGKKAKKKWGHQEHGQKKKGKFKKKKWGKKVKKGKGVKKGKKGKKFLKDKGHKNTGFKTVYHKEEWGKSNKWHDIKREKKWDEKSKKWKKKWDKEKGKKYQGEHMKKFENKKKEGKQFKKAKKEKFKKFKKEKYEAGKKKKMEEHKKKKEGGAKKEEKEMKKKEKKKKKKP